MKNYPPFFAIKLKIDRSQVYFVVVYIFLFAIILKVLMCVNLIGYFSENCLKGMYIEKSCTQQI